MYVVPQIIIYACYGLVVCFLRKGKVQSGGGQILSTSAVVNDKGKVGLLLMLLLVPSSSLFLGARISQ